MASEHEIDRRPKSSGLAVLHRRRVSFTEHAATWAILQVSNRLRWKPCFKDLEAKLTKGLDLVIANTFGSSVTDNGVKALLRLERERRLDGGMRVVNWVLSSLVGPLAEAKMCVGIPELQKIADIKEWMGTLEN